MQEEKSVDTSSSEIICSQCGCKVSGKDKFCYSCGASLTDKNDANYPDNNLNPQNSVNYQNINPLIGVRGWLMLFVVIFLYVSPFSTLIMLISTLVTFSSSGESAGTQFLYILINAIIPVLLCAFGVRVALDLKYVKVNAIKQVKFFMIINLCWVTVNHIIQQDSALRISINPEPPSIINLFLSITGFFLWYSYFSMSKRVKATYTITNE